jgi:hypothetical protein
MTIEQAEKLRRARTLLEDAIKLWAEATGTRDEDGGPVDDEGNEEHPIENFLQWAGRPYHVKIGMCYGDNTQPETIRRICK